MTLLTFLVLGAFSIAGCDDDNPIVETDYSSEYSEYAANDIASTMGSDNGGLNDQFTDLANLVVDSLDMAETAASDTIVISRERSGPYYNNGQWTLKLSSQASSSSLTGSWSRGYRYWYSKNTQRQKHFFQKGSGIADSIGFGLISDSCSGSYENAYRTHTLNQLQAEWACRVDSASNMIRLGSTQNYTCQSTDEVKLGQNTRVSTYTLTLSMSDIEIPIKERFIRGKYVHPRSGTITGTHVASHKMLSSTGTALWERSGIERSFEITYSYNASTQTRTVTVTVAGPISSLTKTLNIETGTVED
ncbi:hypothetical protein [Chloroherpeton thalassium]|nr:hypothetical protein [Chloroherpeton thalassium]